MQGIKISMSLKQKFSKLRTSHFFHPEPELISLILIWNIVLNKANSLRGKDLEIMGIRQAHYIVWIGTSGMKDPCGLEMGWEFIVAIYAKLVILGVHYENKSTV